MSLRKQPNTPNCNPNVSMFVRKTSSASKNSASKAKQLNETICSVKSGENPRIKSSVIGGSIKAQVLEIEVNLAYNGYLQSLLKHDILKEQIKEQEQVLEGQILLQEENIRKREEDLYQIQKETELLQKKEEIIMMINSLEKNIESLKCHYKNHQTQKHIETAHAALTDMSDTLILKNVNPLNTKEEQEKLVESIKKLTISSEKILKSGRDFEGVHELAEKCKTLMQTIQSIKKTLLLVSTMNQHATVTILQKLSDGFAKQYENVD